VEIRTQGAFVTSTQAGPVFTVDDVGGIIVGSQVKANATGTVQRNVSAVTGFTVTTSGPGLGTLNNGDRITVVNTLPVLYADERANDTKANPLTSDANGLVYCWAPVMPYDILESAANYGSQLITDVVPEGVEDIRSNVFSGNATAPFRRSSIRTLTAGNLETVENPTGTAKRTLDYAGNETLTGGLTLSGALAVGGALSVTGNSALTGNLTVGGTLGVTGLSTLTGGATVASAFTYSGVKANFSLTAGSIETADLDLNAVSATFVGSGTTDQALVAAAAYADVASATVTFTPFSSASEIEVIAVIPGEGAGAGNYLLFARIVDGTAATIYHEAAANQAAAGTANAPMTVTCIARLTGLTGAQTFKVQAKCTTTNVNLLSNSTDRKTRIVVVEHKR
jgi:hypothetical protein